MKCYIYFIINKVNQKRYVGQTTDFTRRKREHLEKLRKNKHPNIKLQNSWNKYGEDSFYIEKIVYDNLTKQELDEQEIFYIQKYNSYIDGFNLTPGGTGGEIRNKLTFDQFCFAYFGNKKYDGMTNRTGKFLGVDSACIAAIRRDESYDCFREKALLLPENEQEKYIKDFEEKMDIFNVPPIQQRKKLTKEQLNVFLSVVSVYGRGAEAAITRYFNISKGLKNHIVRGEYKTEYEEFKKLPLEYIEKLATTTFEEQNLQQYCTQKINKKTKIEFPS